MNIEVTNCIDCPFCNSDEYGRMCNFPESEVEEMEYFDSDMPAPEKCPLRKCIAVVELINKNL